MQTLLLFIDQMASRWHMLNQVCNYWYLGVTMDNSSVERKLQNINIDEWTLLRRQLSREQNATFKWSNTISKHSYVWAVEIANRQTPNDILGRQERCWVPLALVMPQHCFNILAPVICSWLFGERRDVVLCASVSRSEQISCPLHPRARTRHTDGRPKKCERIHWRNMREKNGSLLQLTHSKTANGVSQGCTWSLEATVMLLSSLKRLQLLWVNSSILR